MISLQSIYGIIPKIYGKGKAAKQLHDFMTRLRKEVMAEEPKISPVIDKVVIIDRQVIVIYFIL